MLTAEEARNLSPTYPISAVLDAIETAIRRAALAGRVREVDISANVPQPHSGTWMLGQTNDTIAPLVKALTEAGYRIDTYGGGPGGRGFIRVSW